jgi:hypothetical protein
VLVAHEGLAHGGRPPERGTRTRSHAASVPRSGGLPGDGPRAGARSGPESPKAGG